jgi:methionyl-tRNA formyltransferase
MAQVKQANIEPLRIVYFGMNGAFSGPPLAALLAAGHDVRAIVTPQLEGAPAVTLPIAQAHPMQPTQPARKMRGALPQLAPPPAHMLRQIAQEHALPLLEVGSLRDAATLATLASYQPDAICVACFSHRLPAEVLRIPRLGCLNVHPSLLPENRGPDPLFWTFRRGDRMAGVTIHLMDEGFDSGPLLLQEAVPVPDGISARTLEAQLAARGGKLLAQALAGLATGTLHPVPQDNARASSYPMPSAEDMLITPEMSARHAYNFACGLLAYQPIIIQVEGRTFRPLAPLDYDEQGTLAEAWRLDGDVLSLRCTPGVFRARVALSP